MEIDENLKYTLQVSRILDPQPQFANWSIACNSILARGLENQWFLDVVPPSPKK